MRSRLFTASLALIICTAAARPVEQLAGSRWVIVAIDGRALESRPIDGVDPRPHIVFGQRSYGGHAGCNGLGGLYAQRDSRLYTYPGAQTMMGCGGRSGAQEAAFNVAMRAGPRVEGTGDAIELVGATRRLSLSRTASLPTPRDPPEAWQGTRLVGQRFEMHTIDGTPLSRRPAPLLAFTANIATLRHLCSKPVTGRFVHDRGTLRFTWSKSACLGQRFPVGSLTTVSGPNGELLLAGDRHWLAGDNLRRNRPKGINQ